MYNMPIIIRTIDLHATLHTVENRKRHLDCFRLHSEAEHGPDIVSEKALITDHASISLSQSQQKSPQYLQTFFASDNKIWTMTIYLIYICT